MTAEMLRRQLLINGRRLSTTLERDRSECACRNRPTDALEAHLASYLESLGRYRRLVQVELEGRRKSRTLSRAEGRAHSSYSRRQQRRRG